MPDKVRRIKIPFEQHNNLVIIPLVINRFVTLKFILDTGVETAILTEKLYTDILDVNYSREITISGPGIVDSVEAYVATGVTFTLPGGVTGNNMNMLVLKEDYLKLSEGIGDDVHGIIGYDIFSRFIVDIDYDENVLTLIDPNKFRPSKKATAIPIDIIGSKPFINATIKQKENKASLNMLVDTGASHATLIDYNFLDGMALPDKRIITQLGRGIAGDIPGYVGRMDSVQIEDFGFDDILVSAPFEGAYNKVIKRGARIGTFGGELLTRFRVTFDYNNKMMYLKRSQSYEKDFEYDMSGLTLNSVGSDLDTLKVIKVDPGTPASEVDIRRGDIIQKMNGKTLMNYKLSQFFALLRSRDGKKIKVKLLRDGVKMKKTFYLRRAI